MNKYLTDRAADVLLVMGDLNELRQFRDSLHQAKVKNRLHHIGNVAEARLYMRREGPYKKAPVPGLVLLDASLPQRGVIDLITELKTDAQFAGIPVIVLVGSESEQHLTESCLYAVDGSIEIPLHLPDLVRLLTTIDSLSFLLVQSAPDK
jgi:DNA-binding response OmpR family regulator